MAAQAAHQAWREEVLAALVMSLNENDLGEFEIQFAPQCFVAGTPVATEKGLKAIEEIQIGDKVWAWKEATAEMTLRPVLNRFVHRRNEVFDLQVGCDSLQVTGEHPFYLLDKGWTPTRDIQVGDLFVTDGAVPLPVERIERQLGNFLVFNFEVGTDHNYFVGGEALLTHNVSAANLRSKLGIGKNPFLSAHHIVSRFGGGANGRAARDVLRSVGVSLESLANGVALPRNIKAHAAAGAKWANAATHSRVHTKVYYQKLARELQNARALGGQRAVLLKLEEIGGRLKLGVSHPVGAFP